MKANAVGLDVMGSPTKKISQQKKLEQNNERHSYSGKRLLSDVCGNLL